MHAKQYTNAVNEEDPRFRIDYKKLLPMVAKEREVVKIYRYGPNLPHVPTKAKVLDFINEETAVADIKRSVTEVENTAFVVLSGNEYLYPAIDYALTRGVTVELWSWKHSIATQFESLSRLPESNFTAYYLDDQPLNKVGYIEFLYKSKYQKPIDPDHAIECIVPSGQLPLNEIFEYFEKRHLLIFIRQFKLPHDETHQRLVIEIQNTDSKTILEAPRDFKYEFSKFEPWQWQWQ